MLANAPSSFFESNRVMVLATARLEELGPDLDRLVAKPDVLHVRLGRLDDASIGAMAADMIGQKEVPTTLTSFLARESQGNPFFAAEYVRAAVDAYILHRDARGRWQYELGSSDLNKLALPKSIQELVRRRLEALPPGPRRLLQGVGSILGREFDPDILAAVASGINLVSDANLLDLLADLTGTRSSRRRPGIAPPDARPPAGQRAELSVPDARRTELHKHIGQVLETWHAREGTLDRAYGHLAHHFDRGRELAKALDYDLAGAQARARTRPTRHTRRSGTSSGRRRSRVSWGGVLRRSMVPGGSGCSA